MNGILTRVLARKRREDLESEIDEEFRLHLDLLINENLRQGMSVEEARSAALRRFGNVDEIRDQCVEISKKSRPLIVALKFFLILLFLGGVSIRIAFTELHATRVGDMLIAISLLGRLFLYAREPAQSGIISRHTTASPLKLSDTPARSISTYDQKTHTPLERVIFDK